MKIIKPSYEIEQFPGSIACLRGIEVAGRTCYKSEDKITDESAPQFVAKLIASGHESVLEHQHISVRFIVDRGVSHELVRHRLASFSQESTRYCNYGKGGEVTFIVPPWVNTSETAVKVGTDCASMNWYTAMLDAEESYIALLDSGWSPQQARSVLPNSLKTEIVVSTNLRHWREIFRQRTAKAAHPQMREVMCPLLDELKTMLPVVFDDIEG